MAKKKTHDSYDLMLKIKELEKENKRIKETIIPSGFGVRVAALEWFTQYCYANSREKGFWTGLENDNIPTKIALMHSELSEMLEAYRDGNKPILKHCNKPNGDRLTGIEEEAADVFIRLADFCGRLGINLGEVVHAKMDYNANRPHMHGGKKV